MVSARRASKHSKLGEEDGCSVNSGGECKEKTPEHDETRGKKRARTTKVAAKDKEAQKRRKKGKLSMLPEMPVDILYEVCTPTLCSTPSLTRSDSQIFSLVHPKDLLHISWTAKILNKFLTSKSSRHIWQTSFKTVPEKEQPPPCPSEMTEMAFANLVYGRYCTVRISMF
jgi:hypothetical protein